jgi:hypothetical protein
MELYLIILLSLVFVSIVYYFIVQQELFVGEQTSLPQKKINGEVINNRIVVSLTTSPTRIKEIDNILEILEEQTLLPDIIYIHVPHYFKRNCEKYDEKILKRIEKKYPLAKINRVDDVGPITKLVSILSVEPDPETLVIVVDDDEGYQETLIEKLVGQFLKDPTVALCNDVDKYVRMDGMDTPGVYAGFIFKRGMIQDDIFELIGKTNLYKHCYNSDDYIIGLYFKRKNIRIKQPGELTENYQLEYGGNADALKNQDSIYHNERYDLCKKYIDCMVDL